VWDHTGIGERRPPVSSPGVIGPGSESEVKEWSLVIAAVGIPHRIVTTGERWSLQLDASRQEDALRELRLWKEQTPLLERQPVSTKKWRPGLFIPLLPVVTHLLYSIPGEAEAAVRLFGISGQGLAAGELWRPLTALFVHTTVLHLLFNILPLMLIVPTIKSVIGPGAAWTLLLIAAASGNVTATQIRGGAGVLSIGASTAVFAALGMVLMLRSSGRQEGGTRKPLLAAGTGLLFLVMSSGPLTDHAAHLFGLGYGFIAGLIAAVGAARGAWFSDGLRQVFLGFLSWGLVCISFLAALL